MPSDRVIALPWAKRDSGVTRSRSCPSADQSRCASSISLSDFEIQTALRRPAQPVVQDYPGRLTAFACPGAVAQHETAAEADRVSYTIGCSADRVESLVHGPTSGKMVRMGFAGIDHCLQLGIGQAMADVSRQHGPIGRLRRRDRGHGRRLHQLCRVWYGTRNLDRLQAVFFVDRI